MIAAAAPLARRPVVAWGERTRLAVGLASMTAFPLLGAAAHLDLVSRSGYVAGALLSLAAFALAVGWPDRPRRDRARSRRRLAVDGGRRRRGPGPVRPTPARLGRPRGPAPARARGRDEP